MTSKIDNFESPTINKSRASNKRRALVIGAHPDDAEIGAAGTICHLNALNYECAIATASVGVNDPVKQAKRIEVAHRSAQLLNCELFWPLSNTNGHVEDRKSYELVGAMDAVIQSFQPDIIITHTRNDSHCDHRLVAYAVVSATRKWFGSLYAMPPADIGIYDGFAFTPNLFVDTKDYQKVKQQVIELYNYPNKGYKDVVFPRISQRDAYYGGSVKQEFCEAFEVVRQMQLSFH